MISLKFNIILSSLKLIEFIAGVLRTKMGASVSFGPPEGDTILAHLGKMLIINMIIKIENANFFNEMLFLRFHKQQSYTNFRSYIMLER